MDLDSLPPLSLDTVHALEERMMARDIYEHAVMLAIKNSDKPSFQNYMSILRPYYTELRYIYISLLKPMVQDHLMTGFCCIALAPIRSVLPPSDLHFSITGLHLLYLLVENELSVFHSEVRFYI